MFRAVCIATLILATTQMEAKTKQVSYGMEEYSHETLDALQVFGAVRLTSTKVRDQLEVNGQVNAENCEIGKLRVRGHAVLDNCVVRKKSNIQGFLEVSKCRFLDTVTVYTEHLILESCTITALHISDNGGEQMLELKGDTKITGTIKFESGRGIVVKDPTAEFKGELIGGILKS